MGLLQITFDTCPICDSSAKAVLLTFQNAMRFLYGKFIPVRLQKSICTTCGHIFSDLYYTFDELKNHYENTRDSSEDLIYSEKDSLDETFTNLTAWAHDLIERSGSDLKIRNILDVGCGKCDLLRSYAHLYPDAVLCGIDFSPQARSYGDQKGISGVVVGNFMAYDFNRKFDLISATGVLEHQVALHQFLAKIASLCQQGALLLLEVPDSYAILNGKPNLKAKYMHDICNDEHVHHFNLHNLSALLTQYGFSVLGHRTIARGDWQALDLLCQFHEAGRLASRSEGSRTDAAHAAAALHKSFVSKRAHYLRQFAALMAAYDRVGIYGAGWHTSILLPSFFEMDLDRVKMIFDRDKRKVNGQLFGKTVHFPDRKRMDEVDAILISSINMEDSMHRFLLDMGVPSRKIIRLYEVLDEQSA
ncbi:MAG: class I SAM-dependent methyltransferase [bacterium]